MLRRVEYYTEQRIYKFDVDSYIDHLYKTHTYIGINNITDACLGNVDYDNWQPIAKWWHCADLDD